MKSFIFILGAFLFLVCATASNGRSPHSIEVKGTVVAIDFKKRTFHIEEAPQEKTLHLAWNNETEFIRDLKYVSPNELKVGLKIIANFHDPFLGQKFVTVTRIKWSIEGASKMIARRRCRECAWCSREY